MRVRLDDDVLLHNALIDALQNIQPFAKLIVVVVMIMTEHVSISSGIWPSAREAFLNLFWSVAKGSCLEPLRHYVDKILPRRAFTRNSQVSYGAIQHGVQRSRNLRTVVAYVSKYKPWATNV